MKKKSSKKPTSNRSRILGRFGLISAAILIFACLISYQLFSTTVVNADKWNAKANKDLTRIDTIAPIRGDILAADGTVLATNLCYYNVRIDFGSEAFDKKTFREQVGALSDSLAKYFPQKSSEQWKQDLTAQFSKEKKSRSYRLLKEISYDELEKVRTFPFLNLRNRNKSGYQEETIMKRVRPYGKMAQRSIGSIGFPDSLSRRKVGISGLEKALEPYLYGTPGVYKRVPLSRGIENWTDVPAVNGYNVTTTIDITMQDIVEEELAAMLDSTKAKWGTAVLMDVKTGDIKAIANLEEERDKNDKPTGRYIEAFNRAALAYEPGSVVKTISMMFALENGLVSNIDSIMEIGSSYTYAKRSVKDSHFCGASGPVSTVIEQSSNIGIARIITKSSGPYHQHPEKFADEFYKIGFCDTIDMGIAGAEVPRIKRNPTNLDLSRMCFGYSTAIPPLYTLSIYNAIANDGKYVKPRLVKRLSREGVDSIVPVTYIRDRICSEENAEKLRKMLRLVVWGDHGTARNYVRSNLVEIAGKTGTVYNYNFKTKQYETNKKRLAFCGFFPYEQPQYSMIVLIYHPRQKWIGAGSTSGQVMKNVAEKLYARGMLGNTSDYQSTGVDSPAPMIVNTTGVPDELCSVVGVSSVKKETRATTQDGAMPSVKGLGMNEAIAILEKAGYKVKFTGVGYVKSQTYDPVTETVNLTFASNY